MLREIGDEDSDENQTIVFYSCLAIAFLLKISILELNWPYIDRAKFQEPGEAKFAQ